MSEFKKSYRSFFAVLFLFVFSMNLVAEGLYVDQCMHGYLEHHKMCVSQEHAQDGSIMSIAVPVVVPAATVTIAAAAEVTAGICFLGGCIYSIFWATDAKKKSDHGSCNNGNGNNNRCFCGHACGLGCNCLCYCVCGTHNRHDQEAKNKHPHGIYKDDAKYHHGNSKGNGKNGKSPVPKNGQKALDNSIEIEGNGNGRVGVSEGQIVILRLTSEGVFHGYVLLWEAMRSDPDMRKTINNMVKAGLINGKGKILK